MIIIIKHHLLFYTISIKKHESKFTVLFFHIFFLFFNYIPYRKTLLLLFSFPISILPNKPPIIPIPQTIPSFPFHKPYPWFLIFLCYVEIMNDNFGEQVIQYVPKFF